MRIGRYQEDASVADLSAAGFDSLTELLEDSDARARAEAAETPTVAAGDVTLLTPLNGRKSGLPA